MRLLLVLLVFTFCIASCTDENNIARSPAQAKELQINKSPKDRIENSINDAKQTQNRLESFRASLFKDAIEQTKTILCSSFRIMELKSIIANRNTATPGSVAQVNELLFNKISELLAKQNLVTNNKNKNMFDIHIQQSDVYGKQELLYVVSRAEIYPGVLYGGNPGQDFSGNDLLGFSDWALFSIAEPIGLRHHTQVINNELFEVDGGNIVWEDPIDKSYVCEPHFREPIPNNTSAREIELNGFSLMIATSLARLGMYEERLPILEQQISTTLLFKVVLIKMRNDFSFDVQDPLNTEFKLRKYDAYFDEALRTISDWKTKFASDMEVSTQEIERIKSLF